MRLLKLELHNFKGLRDFVLEPDGHDVEVRGDNATGKTTIFDAYLWLLFGKDSAGQASFEVKTLDAHGQPLHNLEHSVTGVFELDGMTLELAKTLKETWTKKRGSATATFQGHSTTYAINGVPTKAKEYEQRVAEIAPEALFRLLTNPLYFNESIHWKERRQTLLEVCGDITDADVIAANADLEPLRELLEKRSLEDQMKVSQAERKRINDRMKEIPARIDEVSRSLPVLESSPESAELVAREKVEGLQKQIAAKREQIQRIESGGETAELTKDLRTVEGEIQRLKNEHQHKVDAATNARAKELRELEDSLAELRQQYNAKVREIEAAAAAVTEQHREVLRLRAAWNAENERAFVPPEQPDTCPACGQDIPQERVDEVRQAALEEFNAAKAQTLQDIQARGRARSKTAEEHEEKVEALEAEKEELKSFVEQSIQAVDAKREEPTPEIPAPAELQTLEQRRQDLEKRIADIETGAQDQLDQPRQDLQDLETKLDAARASMATVEQLRKGRARIAELETEQKRLAAEFERLEHELQLCEQFIRTKVELLEDKINSRFAIARFRLFEEQINGGLTETCVMTVNGVPYASMNRAARLQGGLDIINTLAAHHDFHPPVFVDNAEAVTRLPEIESQTIAMYVDAACPGLQVEAAKEPVAA